MRKSLFLASAFAGALGPMTAIERAHGRYLRAPDHDSNTDGGKTVEQLAAETKSLFEKKTGEVREIAEKALAEAEKGTPLSVEAKKLADEAITGWTEAKARLDELEQKIIASAEGEPKGEFKSAGEWFIENDDVKAMMEAGRGKVSVELDQKAIISSLTTDADGSAGDLLTPIRLPLVDAVERRMTIRDLLMPGQIGTGAFQYPRESGFTNAAATHTDPAGTTKPQSELKFEIENGNVTTIAHWIPATVQILDDAPMLRSYIDGRLRYGLRYAEELQLLNGDGVGTNLDGVYTQATAMGANPGVVAFPQRFDVIRFAILQAALAELPPSGIVLHPTDWALIELTKDENGRYIIGNPAGEAQPRLWGLPVVPTQAMGLDKFLVGAFSTAAQIFDRQTARVEMSTEDSDNFRKNLVTIRAEERLGLAVYRPEAFIKGDFSDAITDITA
jgi:HK97 family phage major capsid protein